MQLAYTDSGNQIYSTMVLTAGSLTYLMDLNEDGAISCAFKQNVDNSSFS